MCIMWTVLPRITKIYIVNRSIKKALIAILIFMVPKAFRLAQIFLHRHYKFFQRNLHAYCRIFQEMVLCTIVPLRCYAATVLQMHSDGRKEEKVVAPAKNRSWIFLTSTSLLMHRPDCYVCMCAYTRTVLVVDMNKSIFGN